MNYATGLFSSVFTLYTDINPSTLSGANDVIVVENEGVYKCTPFELRFGKMDMFRISTRTIHIIINGKYTDLVMNISKTGEVFFIEKDFKLKLNCYADEIEKEVLSDSEMYKNMSGIKKNNLIKDLNDLENNIFINLVNKSEKYYSESYILNKRYENESKRRFRLVPMVLPDLSNRYSTFRKLINSYEYFSYLYSNYKSIYHILRGSWIYSSFKLGSCPIEGCKRTRIRFSLCGNKRSNCNLEEVFDGCELIDLRDHEKIIVQISGCNSKFYLEFNFFNDLLFLVKNEIYRNSLLNLTEFEQKKRSNKLERINFNDINPFVKKDLKDLGLDLEDLHSYDDVKLEKLLFNLKIEVKEDFSSKIKEEINLEILRKGLIDLHERFKLEKEKRAPWSLFGKRETKKINYRTELTSEQLKSLNLKSGVNEVIFKLSGIDAKLKAKIYFWKDSEKVIVSDIDGTITKSDFKGHLYNFMGSDWTHVGVAHFYTKLASNGYKILYLTSRPLGQSNMTRYYLYNILQDNYKMPDGPILHSTSGVLGALYRELIRRNPEQFKIACLKKVCSIFTKNPFIAGFGNKSNDVFTYKALDISSSKIFVINSQGQVYLDVTKGLRGTHFSFKHFVNQMFPKVKESFNCDNTYNDTEFWRSSLF